MIAGPANTCLIYRPGSGLSGPTVFDTWAGLIAELTALRAANNGSGCYMIMFDDSIVSPAPIPPGAYDMTNVIWEGRALKPTFVTIPEGVIFTGLRELTNALQVQFTGVTPPVSDFTSSFFESFAIDGGSSISASGTGPFLRNANPSSLVIVSLRDGGRIAFAGTQAIDVAIAGPGTGLLIPGFTETTLESNTLSGVPGAFVELLWSASSAKLSEDQPTFTGVGGILFPSNSTVERRFPTAVITAPGPTQLDPNVVARVDTTSNLVVVTLPPAFNNRGVTVIVKDVGGNANVNSIAILPSGGDTIDEGPMGGAITTPKGSLTFVSDGVNDWMITAIYP